MRACWSTHLRVRVFMELAAAMLLASLLVGCNNSPNPTGSEKTNTLFTAFSERSPRYLDPTASYSINEIPYTGAIYEPLYKYHYLKRPYTLMPRVATELVEPVYLDKAGKPLPSDAPGELIEESVYDIPIKAGVMYAPHPAFARDEQGRYRYHALKASDVTGKQSPLDFEFSGTRELVADDFVYALKRQATTRIVAPVFGVFSQYVIGLKELSPLVSAADAKLLAGSNAASLDKPFLDLRQFPLAGATAVNPHLLRIRLHGKYPQWKYWMAMPFTAPIPWEADAFYAQPGMAGNGLSLNRWPVGTGPYMLTEYDTDRRHVLSRNPNFRGEPYPCEGMQGDREAGLLEDCGKTMPFIDKIVFNIEKENVPLKAKFVQGYLDVPEIERGEHGIEFSLDMDDSPRVKAEYLQRGFKFPRSVDLSNWYLGFNWLDPVVGKGDTPAQAEKNRKLRQALSIAIDWEEYSRLFPRRGGEVAMGPLPAGLPGSRHNTEAGINPVTHVWKDGRAVRRPLSDAQQLIAEAGYPQGRDQRSGRPLTLYYDYQRQPTPEIRSELDWMIKQFDKLGVQLEIRATDYNQFQDKMRNGKQQVFWWGWAADYPDAENFLFLLYGPNAKFGHDGENAANYVNAEYDRRYDRLRFMDDGPDKQKLVDEMVAETRVDAPWAFGFFPFSSGAYQSWVFNGKPGMVITDKFTYLRLDTAMRAAKQAEWNQPVWWPVAALLALLVALIAMAWRAFSRRERADGRGVVVGA
ncbi:ABC transporter substrate-binding protein [soil metagenome]